MAMTRELEEVDSALAGAAAKTAQLLCSGLDPAARVPGLSWTAAETAAHLVADLREHAALLAGTHVPPPSGSPVADGPNAAQRGAAANRAQLESFTERDLTVLAEQLPEAVAGISAAAAGAPVDEPVVTANGVEMTPSTLLSICLGEQLIHGLDLARSAGRPWPIDEADALRVIPGVLAIAGDYVDRNGAAGAHISYELRFGAQARYRVAVDDATLTTGPAEGAQGRPDCIITADPVAFLLLGYGRAGQWGPILRGKLRAGGRRPWLALRFSSLLLAP